MKSQPFTPDVLKIDAAVEIEKITGRIREMLARQMKRRGLVVAISGGIDSSTTAGIAVRAVGPERVLGLLMPEKQSAADTLDLSKLVADSLGVEFVHEDISDILKAVGFYQRYERAVRSVFPDYGEGWKSKIVLPSLDDRRGFNLYSLIVQSPDGETLKKRLPLKAYLEIVAATNFKQRIRKMLEYYHADRLNFAVAGTPNRLEYDQGFFVKLGDGAADIKPIAHLYKSQVYQLAALLGIPAEIRQRKPTTDTYSLEQGQDEFYFSLPVHEMDLCLYGMNHQIPAADVGAALELTPEQVQRVYDDIVTKRKTTRYLHLEPLLMQPVPEIHSPQTTSNK